MAEQSAGPRPLLIFPCNGNAIEALHCLGPKHQMCGFIDDTAAKQAQRTMGHVVHPRAALAQWPNAAVLAVPGSPASYLTRRALIESLGLEPARWATVIHPSAQVSPLATIGKNVLIMAGVVITSNAVIGDHVCVLPNTVIHHDARVGDWSLIGANVTIAGHTVIGQNCYVGSGSHLMNGLHIGDTALVGLGSTVVHDVPAAARVAGNPARLLRPAT
jgi:sugar O-acyltransferase (sialic acid O-acetyltransferase NeuD family)